MSDQEGKSGRAGTNGAPADDGLGMGPVDGVNNAPAVHPRPPSFGFKPDELEAFQATGHELIPLNAPNALDKRGRAIGKAPRRGWRHADPISVGKAKQCLLEGVNVGVRLRTTDLVVDVDPRNFAPSDNPVRRLEEALDVRLDDWPHVVTGSGGDHFYMQVPEGFLASDSLEDYQGIEFKGHGRQVVAPGSSHPHTRQPYIWDNDPLATPLTREARMAPDRLLELIKRAEPGSAAEAGSATPEHLEAMLQALDPADYRDHGKWLELMMACHHATGGDGREEFLDWSASDPAYSEMRAANGRRWDSLNAERPGRKVTERTLFKALIGRGREDLIPRSDPADDFPDDLGDLPERFQEPSAEDRPKPVHALADKWVWVTKAEQFINRKDCQRLSPFQFKSHYQHLWTGDILSAVWTGKLPIRKYSGCVYVPGADEVVAGGKWDGHYNTWRPGGVEPKRDDELAQVFLDHMAYLLPDETERGHALDYLAFLVRDDFVKVHFALLIQGAPGTGKSFIGSVVERMIGIRNTRMVKSQELTKEYTAWQEDRQLAIVEEIMAFGRREIANELKTVITGDELRIRRMRTDTYEVPNGLNLLCFTNHEDSVPIEEGDRRWLTVFSPAKPKENAYYAKIFELLKGDRFAAAVKWMLQHRDAQLDPKGMAPMTGGKAEMRRRSVGEVEQYLNELLEERAPPFDLDLVRVDDVWRFVKADFKGVRDLRGRVIEWLKSVGAVQHSRYTKQDGSDRVSSALWSLRDHERWEEAGAGGRADFWTKYNGMPAG